MGKWGGRVAARLVRAVLATYGDRCHLCHRLGADSADHVIPRSRGGPDTLANMRPVHHTVWPRCNRERGDMTMTEWFTLHPEYKPRPQDAPPPSARWKDRTE